MKTPNFWTTCWSNIRKKASSWTVKKWILCVSTSIVVVAIVVALIGTCQQPVKRVEQKLYGEEIGTKGLRYKQGAHIYNPKTNLILVDSIDWLHVCYGDTIAILAKNHKRAYINLNNAQLLTSLDYDKAWEFACDRGVMVKGDSAYVFRRNGSMVNQQGIYCECPYELIYYKTRLNIRTVDGKMGLLDTASNWALEPIYKDIETYHHQSLYNTMLEDECIVYDFELKPVLEGKYKKIEIDRSEGLVVTEHNGIQHLFSYQGKMICETIYKSIEELNYKTNHKNSDDEPIYEETACLIYVDYNGKKGLMDKNYNILTPPMFTNIEAQTRHVFFASFGEYCDRFGTLIDDHGKQIR